MKNFFLFIMAFPILAYAQQDTSTAFSKVMDEIVVSATRSETLLYNTPEVIRVINSKEIKQLNPSTIGEVLNYVSGINIEGGTGSGLPKRSIVNINGFPANYNLVLIDGVRLLSDHIHTGQNVELVPVDNIEQIEVIYGASSAQYGSDALGGIVNIITKKCKDEPRYSFQFDAGSYQTYSGGVSVQTPLNESLKNSAYIGWEESRGADIIAPAHRIGKMGYNTFSFMDNLNVKLSEKTHAFGLINYIYNNNQWTNGYQYSFLLSPTVGLKHEIQKDFNVSAKLSYIRWQGQQSSEINVLSHPEIIFNYSGLKDNFLHFGADYKKNQFSRTGVPAHSQYSMGFFVQGEHKFSDKFSSMTALRFDKVESIDLVFSPKLSLLYKPFELLNLRASVGRGFHAPGVQELYELGYGHGGRALRFGNENLKPEYSTNLTFGGELMFTRDFSILLNTYYSRLENMIVPVYKGPWEADHTKDVWMRENIHRASMYGAEVVLRLNFMENYTIETGFNNSKNKNEETHLQLPYNSGSSEYVKLSAFHIISDNLSLNAFAGIKLVQGRSTWNWTPNKGAAVDDPSGTTTTLRDYQKLDAGINVNLPKNISLFINIYNMLGQEIDQLDDAYTVYKGEPNYKFGIRFNI